MEIGVSARKEYRVDGMPEPISHYTDAVQAGGLLFVSGCIPVDARGRLVGGDDVKSQGLVTIATLRRGQSFGEVALVDQGLRSASARCAANGTQLLVIPRDKLILLCDTYPQLGYRLMRNLAADLALKIRSTDLRIREELLYGQRRR